MSNKKIKLALKIFLSVFNLSDSKPSDRRPRSPDKNIEETDALQSLERAHLKGILGRIISTIKKKKLLPKLLKIVVFRTFTSIFLSSGSSRTTR